MVMAPPLGSWGGVTSHLVAIPGRQKAQAWCRLQGIGHGKSWASAGPASPTGAPTRPATMTGDTSLGAEARGSHRPGVSHGCGSGRRQDPCHASLGFLT